MAQVLLDIAQNASIRSMRVDGEDRFSVLDFITYVCPGRCRSYAAQTWFHMTSPLSRNNVPVAEYFYYRFDVQRPIDTPCMAIPGLQKLLLVLGRKASAECSDRVLECFNRVLAGDRTPIRELRAEPQIALPGAWDPQDPDAYTVQEGALVSDTITGMIGPPCDENRDARHKLQLKIQELHAKDPAKAAQKVEGWMFMGNGTMWVNATSVTKYMYTGSAENFARTQKSIFDGGDIQHKLIQVPGVRNHFKNGGFPIHPKPPALGGLRS